MNEDELKNLWQTDETTPRIDVELLQKNSDVWYGKLRRKARIDVWAQGITTAISFIPVLFFPRLIIASILALILGIWYVRELRGLYKNGGLDIQSKAVSESITEKINYLSRFFWRTRIALYIFMPLTLIATYFGLDFSFAPSIPFESRVIRLTAILFFAEVLVVILCEIYFIILYKPALKQLKKISKQMDPGNCNA